MNRAAVALLHRDDGRVLSVARKGRPRDLGLPGGRVERDEDVVTAALRELREETTLVARRGVEVWRGPAAEPDWEATVVLVERWEGEASSPPGEGDVAWVYPWEMLGAQCTQRAFYERFFEARGIDVEPAADVAVVRVETWGEASVSRTSRGDWFGIVHLHGLATIVLPGRSRAGTAAGDAVQELLDRGPAIMIGVWRDPE